MKAVNTATVIRRGLVQYNPFVHPPLPPPSTNPPPQRKPREPAPLPSNIARLAARDSNLALAGNMLKDVDRNRYKTVREYDERRAAILNAAQAARARDLERQNSRLNKWKPGDVYAPHDLSAAEAKKWRARKSSNRDVFDVLGIRPLEEYKNPSIMFEYMTAMGRIRHRRDTGLRAVNQRKIAKAIRRAVGMGLLPSVHEHPEVLEAQAKARATRLEHTIGPGSGGVR